MGAGGEGGEKRQSDAASMWEKSSVMLSSKLLKYERLLLPPTRDGGGDAAATYRNRMILKGVGATKEGQVFKFVPMLPNGNCGFLTVAMGAGRVLKRNFSSYDMRLMLCNEVRGNRSFYLTEALRNPVHGYHMEGDPDFSSFEKSVMKTGWNGHWLGEKWGMLEIKSLARALKLCIEVFCYDEKSNSLRSYHEEKYGDKHVGMFFSGVSNRGHFDLLMRQRKPGS